MQFAHNGFYKGSIPFGLIYYFRVLGRVWFKALVLKTRTWIKSWVQISQCPSIKLFPHGTIYILKMIIKFN